MAPSEGKKSESTMAEIHFLTKLPLDVVFQILAKIPPKSLLQLRLVSKYFKALISHPHFLNLHLSAATAAVGGAAGLIHYESTDYTKSYFSFHAAKNLSICKTLETPFKSVNGYLRIVGSRKGVICLFDTSYNTFVGNLILWNPSIGKFKILPLAKELSTNSPHMVVGFGFDDINLDFKVVKILYDSDHEHEFPPKALIFRVKSGYWSVIDAVIPCFMPMTWSSSVFVNGGVHWLGYKWEKCNDEHPNCVMVFDLVYEVFNLMDLPRNLEVNAKELRLSDSCDGKSLALFVSYHDHVGEFWDIWFMSDYGNVDSWTKNRVVRLEKVLFPIRVLNDDEILGAISEDKLGLIDVEKGDFSVLEVCGLSSSFYADDYVPTLAMLDIGEQLRGL